MGHIQTTIRRFTKRDRRLKCQASKTSEKLTLTRGVVFKPNIYIKKLLIDLLIVLRINNCEIHTKILTQVID